MQKTIDRSGTKAVMKEFHNFISERVADALCEAQESIDFAEALNELNRLSEEEKALIPAELYMGLDAAINRVNTIEYDHIYRRGFFDAIDFLKCGNVPLR